MRPLVTLACWIGFRRGVGTTKNKDGRLVYLPAEALAALRAWRERASSVEREQTRIITRVFHRSGEPIPVRNFPYEVRHAARERAKLPHRVPHDFRRTMARNYRRSGEAEGVIMKIGGWKTRSVFERYNVVNEDDLRRAAERVVDSNGAKTGQIVIVDAARTESHGA